MSEIKPWYLSKTIWAAIVTILTGIGGVAGLPVAGIDNTELTQTILQAVSALSGLVAIFGRLSATSRLL